MADVDTQENVAKKATDEPEMVTISVDVEPIVISDNEEMQFKTREEKEEYKKARKRQWRADAPKNKVCDTCSKAFKTNAELTRHARTHTGERPFICAHCGNTYTQLSHLQEHTAKHHSTSKAKNVKCEECFSTFYRKCDLDRHMKTHTGEKPWKCDICAKCFTQKGNLLMHLKVHADDRPYECTECGKRFITQSKMKRHMRKHGRKVNRHFLTMSDVDEDGDVITDN